MTQASHTATAADLSPAAVVSVNSRISPLVYLAVVGAVLLVAVLVYALGFGFLITVADTLALLGIAMLVYMSAGDIFSAAGRRETQEMKAKRAKV